MVSRRSILATAALSTAAPLLTPKLATAAGRATMTSPPPLPLAGSLVPVGAGFTIANSQGQAIMDQALLQADLQRALTMGSTWVRLGVPLWLVGGVWQGAWSTYSVQAAAILAQFQAAKAAGLKVVCTLTAPTENPTDKSLATFLEVNRQALTAIVTALGPFVDAWQVLNEWNLSHYRTNASFTTAQSLSPEASYLAEVAQYLTMASGVILGKQPGAIVTSALGGYPADGPRWASWEKIYTATGKSLTAWGVNAYPDPGVPTQVASQTAWLRHMRGTAGKPVMILETGMSTGSSATVEEARTVVPAMVHSLAWGAPTAVFLYQLRDLKTGDSDGEANFGVYTTEGSSKAHWPEVTTAMTSVACTPVVA